MSDVNKGSRVCEEELVITAAAAAAAIERSGGWQIECWSLVRIMILRSSLMTILSSQVSSQGEE